MSISKTVMVAILFSLTLGACQSGDASLTARWLNDCVASGHGDRHLGLSSCLAASRADHEADALSAAAAY